MSDIAATLKERGSRYGEFDEHAIFTQNIKEVFYTSTNWYGKMEADQKEALEMIAHKIGRILNGDPNYADSWVDIAGYAKLVGDRLEREAAEQKTALSAAQNAHAGFASGLHIIFIDDSVET